MDKILYKLDTFEGPLDLLLTLIQKNKVSIYDIPIVEITAQYLEAIDGIEEANLDNTSEFLVMASNLLYIKSKMLLPKNEEEEDEETGDEMKLTVERAEGGEYKEQEFTLTLDEKPESAKTSTSGQDMQGNNDQNGNGQNGNDQNGDDSEGESGDDSMQDPFSQIFPEYFRR